MKEAVRMVMEDGKTQAHACHFFKEKGIVLPQRTLSMRIAEAKTENNIQIPSSSSFSPVPSSTKKSSLPKYSEIDMEEAVSMVQMGMTEREVIKFFKQQEKPIPRGTLAERVIRERASLLTDGTEKDMQMAVRLVMGGQTQINVRRHFITLGKSISKSSLSKQVAAAREAANIGEIRMNPAEGILSSEFPQPDVSQVFLAQIALLEGPQTSLNLSSSESISSLQPLDPSVLKDVNQAVVMAESVETSEIPQSSLRKCVNLARNPEKSASRSNYSARDMTEAVAWVMQGETPTNACSFFQKKGIIIPKSSLSKQVAAARKAAKEG